jgi:hypothetical protein
MNNLMAILAFVLLAFFLSILIWHVPRTDLTVIIVITLVLAGWDLFNSLFRHRR